VDFFIEDGMITLNGVDKNETEKAIIEKFGSPDYFMMSSIITQFNSMQFVESASTKEKEILSNFLDLKSLDLLFDEAKELFKRKRKGTR
jgi:DNA repair exonuclease SbcCD ATPase subunit